MNFEKPELNEFNRGLRLNDEMFFSVKEALETGVSYLEDSISTLEKELLEKGVHEVDLLSLVRECVNEFLDILQTIDQSVHHPADLEKILTDQTFFSAFKGAYEKLLTLDIRKKYQEYLVKNSEGGELHDVDELALSYLDGGLNTASIYLSAYNQEKHE